MTNVQCVQHKPLESKQFVSYFFLGGPRFVGVATASFAPSSQGHSPCALRFAPPSARFSGVVTSAAGGCSSERHM